MLDEVISVDSKSNDPRFKFEANPTLDELIAQQGKVQFPIFGVAWRLLASRGID